MTFTEGMRSVLENPILNGWGFVIGVIGLLFSGFVWWEGRSFPELTTHVLPSRTIIARPGLDESIKVLVKGVEVKSQVTSAQIGFWNAGDSPVRAEDVLDPLRLEATPSVSIVNVRLLRMSREAIKPQVTLDRLGEGRVGLAFRILEKGDGILAQVTYLGPENVAFHVKGAVVGQGAIAEIGSQPPMQYASLSEALEREDKMSSKSWRLIDRTFKAMLLILGIGVVAKLFYKKLCERKEGRREDFILGVPPYSVVLGGLVLLIVMLVSGLAQTLLAPLPPAIPPFIFK